MGWCRKGRLLGGSTVGVTLRDKENRWHWPGCRECSLVFCCIVQTKSGLLIYKTSGTDKFYYESKQRNDLAFKWTNQLSPQVHIAVESAGKNSNSGKRHQVWNNFAIWELMTSIVQQSCQIIERSIEKVWARGWLVLAVNTKRRNISLVSRAKN